VGIGGGVPSRSRDPRRKAAPRRDDDERAPGAGVAAAAATAAVGAAVPDGVQRGAGARWIWVPPHTGAVRATPHGP